MGEKVYHLISADGEPYDSFEKGTHGGNSRNKVYGRLDCPAALKVIASGRGVYEKYRVFFKDKETAIKAGYRPCGACMREKYFEWKNSEGGNYE